MNQRLEHSSGWAPDMKSNYLPKASALLNSRIPSLQVSKSPSHRLENHDPGPPAPASAKPLCGTPIHRYVPPSTPQNVNATSPAEMMKIPAATEYSQSNGPVLTSVLRFSKYYLIPLGRSLQSNVLHYTMIWYCPA